MEQETKDLFKEEVDETLAELDVSLLELEKTPDDLELVNRVFRAVHTLKGACDMFGVDNVVALAHEMESAFDLIRNGARRVDKPLLDAGFAAKDRIGAMLREGADPDAAGAKDVIQAFRDILSPPEPARANRPGTSSPNPDQRFHRLIYAPSGPARLDGPDPLELLEQLESLGECRTRADLSGLPDPRDLDPSACYARFTIDFAPLRPEDDVNDLFLFLENPQELSIESQPQRPAPRTPGESAPDAAPAPAPSEAPKAQQIQPEQPAREARSARPNPPAATPAKPAPPEPAPRPAPRPEEPVRAEEAAQTEEQNSADKAPQAARRAQVKTETAQSLRVDAGKLDELVNLVGELVIAQARLTQLSGQINHAALTGVAEEIERLSNELRDNTLSIRMLPIGTTFSRFRRLVRDLSSEMQKQIELVTDGGETELDKTVIEQLNDPLVHLLRNSIDHGVESPGERMASGKPPSGRITLSARHAGGEVLLRITDDGRGMNPEAIRRKALEKGLISTDAKLTESEIFNLIFLPGFSTAEKITNISGRGVGMDVVKRSMDALRGKIDVSSRLGEGTEITIKLPLTLAIIDGLQVMTAGEHYIIPLSVVEECVELQAGEAEDASRKRSIHLRGEIVPYIRLREAFVLEGARPAIEQVVVTRHESGRTGIAVDEVIGQQQTVIKSLGAYIGNVEGISGATINGDGTMSLILDVPSLVQDARRKGGAGR